MTEPDVTVGAAGSVTPFTRAGVWQWLLGVTLAAFAVLSLALAFGHGAGGEVPAGLPDPGALTAWGLPVSRLLTDAAGIVVVGLAVTSAFLLPSAKGTLTGLALRALRAVSTTALVFAAASAVQCLLTVSDIFGQPVGMLFPSAELSAFMKQTSTGHAFIAQIVLGLLLAVAARWVRSVRGAAWLLLLAMGLFVPPALTGHSASSGSHDLATVSLMVHVLGVSLWVGGLLGVGWVTLRGSKRLPAAVTRFSTLAAWCLASVAVSGVFNASLRVRHLSQLLTTDYGVLVVVKVLAAALLGLLGWQHRRRTVPKLQTLTEDPDAKRAVWRAFGLLAALELAVMGATVAVAVALSRTPTPVGQPYTSTVNQLLGQAMPPAPTLARLLWGWSPDGVGLVIVGFGAALYLKGLLAMHHRGAAWPVGRTVSWFAGLLVVAWASFGGLGEYSHVMFSLHMLSHMLLAMVAPILLVLGAPMTLALRTLPGPRVPGETSPRQLLLGLLRSRVVAFLTLPVVAAVIFTGSFYVIYFTGLFPALMTSHLGHAFMEVHFLLSGCLFFYVVVGIDPGPRRLSHLVRMFLMAFVMPFHAFFSIAVMSGSTVLGRSYWEILHRTYNTDLMHDQFVGGGLSWAFGEIPIIIVMGAVFVQWVRSDFRDARRIDRAAARAEAAGVEDEHAAYNAYLARLGGASAASAEPPDPTSGQG